IMNPRFYIEKITFNDGTTLECDKNDLIVFVGANNAGKSASLREISLKFRSKINKTMVIQDITIAKDGEQNSLKNHFEKNSLFSDEGGAYFKGFGYQIGSSDID